MPSPKHQGVSYLFNIVYHFNDAQIYSKWPREFNGVQKEQGIILKKLELQKKVIAIIKKNLLSSPKHKAVSSLWST